MSVRTILPTQSKLELIEEIKLLYCLLLRAAYELGDKALLWHVNHGELRYMEGHLGYISKQFQFSILLLTCLV